MSDRYSIGQVLYIVSRAHQKIYPVQVREIHKKQTFQGETTVFMVADPKETSLYNLEELDGDVFMNPDDVAEFLKQNIERSVNALVEKAVDTAKKCFSKEEIVQQPNEDEVLPMKKQDISKANLIAQAQQQRSAKQSIAVPVVPVEPIELEPGPNEAEVMLPNGKLVKTRVNVKVSPIKQ